MVLLFSNGMDYFKPNIFTRVSFTVVIVNACVLCVRVIMKNNCPTICTAVAVEEQDPDLVELFDSFSVLRV